MTATDNILIHIGSRKSGVLTLLHKQFLFISPLISLGETYI